MRVKLVRPAKRHASDFLEAVARSRELHRNLVTPIRTQAEFVRFVNHGRSPRASNFFVVHRELEQLVGAINIEHIVRGFFHSAFLGYYAFTPHAGKGLMREGLMLAIDHAFGDLKLHRLEANIQPSNARSIELVKSLGFRHEGYSPNYLKIAGHWRDHERYALLAETWKGGASAVGGSGAIPQPVSGRWHEGGCHCGGVRFRVRLTASSALECNCSICSKKGFVNLIVEPADFELLQGEELLSVYRFNTGIAEHRFCRHCGIHPFSRPRSHPGSFDVNARCLDDGFAFLDVEPFDGRNWEQHVGSIT